MVYRVVLDQVHDLSLLSAALLELALFNLFLKENTSLCIACNDTTSTARPPMKI